MNHEAEVCTTVFRHCFPLPLEQVAQLVPLYNTAVLSHNEGHLILPSSEPVEEIIMAHSLSQTTNLTHPQCEQPFTADVWLIIDASERSVYTSTTHQEG